MLKAELHAHTSGSRNDGIRHSPKGLIRHLSRLHYRVLAITDHDVVTYSEELADYAGSKGILLIPGTERTIEGAHVLLYNLDEEQMRGVHTFADLARLREDHPSLLVGAPHPFYKVSSCLGKRLIENISLFDVIEHSSAYTRHINPNRKAISVAQHHHKPVIATSDLHMLHQANKNVTFIDAEPDVDSVVEALRGGNLQIGSRPLRTTEFAKVIAFTLYSTFLGPLRNLYK
ncbi:MAG: PHP-associated domain-containing protein [archaeon]